MRRDDLMGIIDPRGGRAAQAVATDALVVEAIKHHEDCMFRAIQDMHKALEDTEREHGRWLKRPGAKGAFRSGQIALYGWAYANALKHERELRGFEGYRLPDYLRDALNNATKAEL